VPRYTHATRIRFARRRSPRAFGAELVLFLGYFYYLWAYLWIGEPSKVVIAVAGAVAATVALAVSLFESGGERPSRLQALIESAKGAGAGAAVIFATLVATDLPNAEDWVGLIFLSLSSGIVLMAEYAKRIQRA
jgi:drug/metabolite transporter (DMT)-like permease